MPKGGDLRIFVRPVALLCLASPPINKYLISWTSPSFEAKFGQ